MKRTFGWVGVLGAVMVGFVAVAAAQDQGDKKAATVSGTWSMTVTGSPHGDVAMGLTLKQDGTKVTGTFASPHGDTPVEGEFADGELTLATTSKEADAMQVTFKAKLSDNGSLAGYLSSQMGDMKWTAERVKDKR